MNAQSPVEPVAATPPLPVLPSTQGRTWGRRVALCVCILSAFGLMIDLFLWFVVLQTGGSWERGSPTPALRAEREASLARTSLLLGGGLVVSVLALTGSTHVLLRRERRPRIHAPR